MIKKVIFPIIIFVVLLSAFIYIIKSYPELALAERQIKMFSTLSFIRIGVLLVLGLIGAILIAEGDYSSLSFHNQEKMVIFGIGAGILMLIAALFPDLLFKTETHIGYLAVLAIVWAISDEFFFRAFIAKGLITIYKFSFVGIILASIIYGVWHYSFYYFYQLPISMSLFGTIVVVTIIKGLPLTILYHESKSLLSPTIAHIIFNFGYFNYCAYFGLN